MSKRHEWKFRYYADKLVPAAQKQADYHRERQAFWTDELAKAEADLRAHGVEFRDTPITGGTRVDAVLDATRQARVNECRSKLTEHKTQAEEYERFWRAFEMNGSVELELDVQDIAFFKL